MLVKLWKEFDVFLAFVVYYYLGKIMLILEMYAMIKIKVKLYAPFNNHIGKKWIEVEMDEDAIFIDLLLRIAEIYPKFRDAIPDVTDRCVFYNNMVPVIDSNVISLQQNFKDGDEISLFGSISGG